MYRSNRCDFAPLTYLSLRDEKFRCLVYGTDDLVEKSLIEDFSFTPALGHRNCLEGNFPQKIPFPKILFLWIEFDGLSGRPIYKGCGFLDYRETKLS